MSFGPKWRIYWASGAQKDYIYVTKAQNLRFLLDFAHPVRKYDDSFMTGRKTTGNQANNPGPVE